MTFALLLLALLGGLLASAIFFGGLWWTTRRIPHAENPALLMFGSWLLRLPLTMLVFYGVMKISGSLLYLGVTLLVFLIVRISMINTLRPRRPTTTEAIHAVES